LFFLVCVWKALNNRTCPRARKMSAGNPMPATFRQPHAGNPKQLATLCQAPVAGIQKSSSTAQSKHCETKKTSNKHLPLPRGRSSDYRYHGVKRKMPSRLPSRLPLPRRQEARVAADRKSLPKELMMRTSAMRTRFMGTCVMSNMTAPHLSTDTADSGDDALHLPAHSSDHSNRALSRRKAMCAAISNVHSQSPLRDTRFDARASNVKLSANDNLTLAAADMPKTAMRDTTTS